jgi:hypothetical protein
MADKSKVAVVLSKDADDIIRKTITIRIQETVRVIRLFATVVGD